MSRGSGGQAQTSITKVTNEQIKSLADSLRTRNGIEWKYSKLELAQGSVRVEFFRGKDFARYFRSKPDQLEPFFSKADPQEIDDRIRLIGERLLKEGLILKVERKYTKPKPGLKRLVKWPRTLLRVPPEQGGENWGEEFFYSWEYERPSSPWLYFWSALMVFMVLGICLYPLAPYKVKLYVSYVSMTLLIILLGLLSVRATLFGVVWVLSGRELWLFPQLLTADDITSMVRPVLSFKKCEGKMGHWVLRLACATTVALMIWFLYSYSPDRRAVKAGAKKAYASFMEFMDLQEPQLLAGETASSEKHRSNSTGFKAPSAQGAGHGQEL